MTCEYYTECYFENLIKEKDEVEARVLVRYMRSLTSEQEFFKKVEPLIPFDSCIVDFAVLDSEVKIVELNPFVTLPVAAFI